MKMETSRRDHRHRPRLLDAEPLRSTQRGDGVWESIEKDDDDDDAGRQIAVGAPQNHPVGADASRPAARSTGTQTSEPCRSPPPTARAPTPTRADLIARVLHCPLPHPDLGLGLPPPPAPPDDEPRAPAPSVRPGPAGAPPGPEEQPPRPLRRGRPRRDAGATQRHHQDHPRRRPQRRRVRFSDPAPAAAEPELRLRDSHVFVRLVRVVVVDPDPDPDPDPSSSPSSSPAARRPRRQFVWNNRAKGWRPAGGGRGAAEEEEEEAPVDVVGLFGRPPAAGTAAAAALRPVVLPVEGGGARQPVEVAWDAGRFCFQGANQDGETLSVTLGEMRESARDPWARQFVGYVMR